MPEKQGKARKIWENLGKSFLHDLHTEKQNLLARKI
jgi:hypothetical protein